MDATAIPAEAAPARAARPRLNAHLVTEGVMWAYGAGMLAWFMATLMSGAPDGDGAALGAVWTVLAVWALGTFPAYGIAFLAGRRFPAA